MPSFMCKYVLAGYTARVSIGHSWCGFACGRYRVIFLVVLFTLPLSYRTCIKWLILCGILTVLRVGWPLCCVVC